MAQVNKIDSNFTGLYYAEESTIGVLPGSPTWYSLEPNSYADFGSQFTLTPRNPINDSRQRRKGQITDENASGGFNHDFTTLGMKNLLQGFFFADADDRNRESANLGAVATGEFTTDGVVNTATVASGGTGTYVVGEVLTVSGGTFTTAATLTITAVDGGGLVTAVSVTDGGVYSVLPTNPVSTSGGSGSGATFTLTFVTEDNFAEKDLIFASGFTNAANNGLHEVTSGVDGVTIPVVGSTLVAETPPSGAELVQVGVKDTTVAANAGTGSTLGNIEVDIDLTGDLEPGSWIYVDGFSTAANNGFKRVYSVSYASTTTTIQIDKSDSALATETAGPAVSIYFGDDLYNKTSTAIKRRTYSLERSLGAPDDANPTQFQYQYLDGQVPNTLTFNFSSATKLEVDMGFVGLTGANVLSTDTRRSGTFVNQSYGSVYNTADHPYRVRLASVSQVDEAPTPLFAFVMEGTIEIDNGANANKALGSRGGFDVSVGDFMVGGQFQAYFSNVSAIEAIATNDDVTLDLAVTFDNKGFLMDQPLIALGDGRPTVEKDAPIMIPLATEAARGFESNANLDYTLRMVFFNYLPASAM